VPLSSHPQIPSIGRSNQRLIPRSPEQIQSVVFTTSRKHKSRAKCSGRGGAKEDTDIATCFFSALRRRLPGLRAALRPGHAQRDPFRGVIWLFLTAVMNARVALVDNPDRCTWTSTALRQTRVASFAISRTL
jgi:hypothetical protein